MRFEDIITSGGNPEELRRTHVYDLDGHRWIRRDSPAYYAWQQEKSQEAAADRAADRFFRQRLEDLRRDFIADQARKRERDVDDEAFHRWLHAAGMGGDGPREMATYYLPTDESDASRYSTVQVPFRRSLSRMQALHQEVAAFKARLLGKQAGSGMGADDNPKAPGILAATLEIKSAPIGVKMAPNGRITGYVASFGNADAYNDIIQPGAFKECLRRRKREGKVTPILWQHDPTKPIGKWLALEEDSYGLKGVGQLDLDIEDGKRAYSGVRNGYVTGLSIGYQTTAEDFDRQGHRLLKGINLMEASLVTHAASDKAVIISYD